MAYDFTARTLTTTAFKAGFNFSKRGGDAYLPNDGHEPRPSNHPRA